MSADRVGFHTMFFKKKKDKQESPERCDGIGRLALEF